MWEAILVIMAIMYVLSSVSNQGINEQNSKGLCQGGKPGAGTLYTDGSAHTSGYIVDGLGATAAH